MRIDIVSNLNNGKGLERDYWLLRGLLEGLGHEVRGVHFLGGEPPRRATDLVIFVEVCEARFLDLAPRRFLVPNPEWWFADNARYLADFDAVLCKTRDALRIFEPLTPRAVLTGFLSADRDDPAVPRERRFFHAPGGSAVKGTRAILEAWSSYRLPYPLTILASLPMRFHPARPHPPRSVELRPPADDGTFRRLQNAHAFHLCPSEYEGWGHYLHEALSVGAAVVTTDAPPMSEFAGCAIGIWPVTTGIQRLATTVRVSPEGIRDAVEQCAALGDAELARIRAVAREAFLAEREDFAKRIAALL